MNAPTLDDLRPERSVTPCDCDSGKAPDGSICMRCGGLGVVNVRINDWIDSEIRRATKEGGFMDAPVAAEIARGAAVIVMLDQRGQVDNLAIDVHMGNVNAGWWTDLHTGEDLHGKRNIGELLALVHSEITEAVEGKTETFGTLISVQRKILTVLAMEGEAKDALLEIHASLSRALEGYRKQKRDDKLPHRPTFRVELIDAAIRIFDILGSDNRQHPAGAIWVEKRSFNRTRLDHTPERRREAGGKSI